MAKLADAADSKSAVARRTGSSPVIPTNFFVLVSNRGRLKSIDIPVRFFRRMKFYSGRLKGLDHVIINPVRTIITS